MSVGSAAAHYAGRPVGRLNPDDAAFLTGVKAALSERSLPTQDELDVFLLGGTVPPHPIPQPDPACTDCSGYGRVCKCHGFAPWYRHCAVGYEKCACLGRSTS